MAAKRVVGGIVLSVVLGYATCWLIGMIDKLPYSAVRDSVRDALSLPGGLIAFPFFPAGVHTGSGAPLWGVVAMWGNILFYSGLWLLLLFLIQKRHASTAGSLHP